MFQAGGSVGREHMFRDNCNVMFLVLLTGPVEFGTCGDIRGLVFMALGTSLTLNAVGCEERCGGSRDKRKQERVCH